MLGKSIGLKHAKESRTLEAKVWGRKAGGTCGDGQVVSFGFQ